MLTSLNLLYKKTAMKSNAQSKDPLSPILFYRKNPSFRSFYL
ncbi:hypothetical protein B4127_4035 [Bacillus pumilus]|uniref:Uncharacterized protein n=1 Tax=Bacillus pumilus TaxID=1408 RepID=A0AB34R0I3_BACPU|nr:hypothetical protein B4127_4035 [Bacillus pumilus]